MKKCFIGLIVCFWGAVACSDFSGEDQRNDLEKYNMKIIPENPGAKDEINLVIFDDCTYNVLSGVSRNGKIIDIRKQFNSMMKWPCVMENDTILIGQLPEGTYTIDYKLLDTNIQVSDPVFLSFSFLLKVSK